MSSAPQNLLHTYPLELSFDVGHSSIGWAIFASEPFEPLATGVVTSKGDQQKINVSLKTLLRDGMSLLSRSLTGIPVSQIGQP
jgi:RNase H-fold protein (predicted Holliday junction resolvase)